MNRDLDAKVAKDIFGWKYVKVGKDCDGKNECSILSKNGEFPSDISLPRMGIIGEAYLVPTYSDDLYLALKLANYVRLETKVRDLPIDPQKITELSYCYYMERKKKKDLINKIIDILKEKYPKIIFINAMQNSVDGISLPNDYYIIALKVPISKTEELRKLLYNDIFIKLYDENEELPCFMSINKEKTLRGCK